METIIETHALTKSYRWKEAVNGVMNGVSPEWH